MIGLSERARRWVAFFGLAVIVVLVDQLSKIYVDGNFAVASVHPLPGASAPTPVIGDFVRIAKSYNNGGIFGLLGNSAPLFAISSLAVIVVILIYQRREGIRSSLLTLALALLLGGAIGNLIDRIRLGWVVDFVDMGIGNTRFYTFNVADSAISIALALLIFIALFRERLGRLAPRAS